jgi:hypothetical protein
MSRLTIASLNFACRCLITRMDYLRRSRVVFVFLCHNSEDKPAVREISRKLAEKKVKPWLDEDESGLEPHGKRRLESNRKYQISCGFCR